MSRIVIEAGGISVDADLNESETARKILEALPIQGVAHRWGEEIYFEIPVEAEKEAGARAEVEVGELGYWPLGKAFCIFFGPTPASVDHRPRAYSPVNILGQVRGDAKSLGVVEEGAPVRLARPKP